MKNEDHIRKQYVHLEYFSGLINAREISKIEQMLSESKLELSCHDKSGIMYNAVDDFMLQVALCLGDKLTLDILLGLVSNVLWDTIKITTIYIWKNVRKRKLTKITSQKILKEKINFGIKICFDKYTRFEFKIDGNLSEKTALQSIDKILDFLKVVKPNIEKRPPDFVVYGKKNKAWEILNQREEIKKQINASKSKISKIKGSH